MEIIEYFVDNVALVLFSALAGAALSYLFQIIRNKRGTFSYVVTHNKIGVSATDPVFGDISVTWNDRPIKNLYFSTIELKNESLNDYEDVIFSTYTIDTSFLSESTDVVDTPNILNWSDSYLQKIHVEPGREPTDNQFEIYSRQREYVIPVFNRGQIIRINYLNASDSNLMPKIWLSSTTKGVIVKFQTAKSQILGVSQPLAALIGVVLGISGVVPLVLFTQNPWFIAFVSLVYGFVGQVPGALLVKLSRKIRDTLGN